MRNPVQRNYINKKTYYTIFNTKDTYPPPFHILLLIYGSSYVYIPEEMRVNYIFPILMSSINESVNRLILDNNNKFIDDFNLMFNMIRSERRSIVNYIRPNLGDGNENANNGVVANRIIGGDPPNRYPPYNYQPYGYQPYGYQQNIRTITKKPEEQGFSKIAYAITIDMELHQGTSLTPEQINESKCNSKYNAIRKAFSEFIGRPYIIPPVYKTTQTKKNVGGRPNRITRRKH
jgi:hypothetical protein